MLQYRRTGTACVYRYWGDNNGMVPHTGNLYGLETYLHEALLQSEHRYEWARGMNEIRYEPQVWTTCRCGLEADLQLRGALTMQSDHYYYSQVVSAASRRPPRFQGASTFRSQHSAYY